MMLTEEEAKKKWCPHARQAAEYPQNDVAVNRIAHDGTNELVFLSCIASRCMAWRFKPEQWKHGVGGNEWTDTMELDGYGNKGEKLPTVGYCGLAGDP